MTGLRAGWRAGGPPSRCWYPAFSRTVLWGTGPQGSGLFFLQSLPCPGGLQQLQHVLLEAGGGGVSMATLTSWTWSP